MAGALLASVGVGPAWGQVSNTNCNDACKRCPAGAQRKQCLDVCSKCPSTSLLCGPCGSVVCCSGGTLCCSGVCRDLRSDESNCGACGWVCAAGETCCNGACTDTNKDPNNCGACGNVCTDAQGNWTTCSNGTCSPVRDCVNYCAQFPLDKQADCLLTCEGCAGLPCLYDTSLSCCPSDDRLCCLRCCGGPLHYPSICCSPVLYCCSDMDGNPSFCSPLPC